MSDIVLEYKLREFTVDEFHRLEEIGVLHRDERAELLNGAIVEMSPIEGGRDRSISEFP